MKLISAYIHHIRSPEVVQALADAGYRNIVLEDVKGMLKPINEGEEVYSGDTTALVISEVKLSLVCEDGEVDAVTALIREAGQIGQHISGWIYVSALDQVLPIGDELSRKGS